MNNNNDVSLYGDSYNNQENISPNNNYNSDAYSGDSRYVKINQYSQKQMSMMSIALLVAGLGFLAIGLIGFGFSELFKKVMMDNIGVYSNLYYTLVALTSIAGIVSLVLYIVWSFRVHKASLGFQIATIVIYCFSNGITFGGIFLLVQVPDIIFAFCTTGVILLISYLVAKIMTPRVAMGLGKLIMILFFIYLIIMIIVIIMSFFSLIPTIVYYDNGVLGQWMYVIIIGVSGLLSILFLVYNLYIIQSMDKFRDQLDPKVARNYAIYFGFVMLINLLRIFYLIIQILGRVKR